MDEKGKEKRTETKGRRKEGAQKKTRRGKKAKINVDEGRKQRK